MGKRRRLLIIVLLILTAVLAGVSIFLTNQIQQNQQIVASHAATVNGCNCSLTGCGNGCWQWNCSNCGDGSLHVTGFTCTNSLANNASCNSPGCGQTNGGNLGLNQTNAQQSGTWTVNQCGASQVDIVYDNAQVTGACFSFSNSCGGNPPPPNPQPPPPPPPPPPAACNHCGCTCNSDSDCPVVSGGGFHSICYQGKCESPLCPTDSEQGTLCYCLHSSGTCGDKCGVWSDGFHPLCGDGVSSCSWINGPNCGGNNETYCMPTSPQNGYTSAQCANDLGTGPGHYRYLIAPDGSVVTTQAQIKQACLAITPKYKCSGTSCVQDNTNGTFTDPNCNGTCVPQSINCYRCTASLTDGNTCESTTTTSSTCPAGYTTNSNCAQAAGGSCPVQTTVGCNQPCNPSNNTVCQSNLACLDGSNNVTTGAGTCRLQSNPNSTTCTTSVTVSCGQTCDGVNTVCGSGQACSAGKCKQNSCISNPSSCDATGCQTLNTVACGQSCDATHICDTANGFQCSGGTCKLNSCVTTPSNCTANGCTVLTTVSCGQSCDATHVCDNTHTCDNGTCKLNSCISNPSSCNANGCTPLSVCGGSCTTSADCSTNHSCVSGTCVLNGCTSGTCTGGCTPLCGGPCTTSADCPTNHTCHSGTCILNGCTPSTCVNGCTPIPNTGILDDARPLFVGLILIIAGYITFKFRIGRNLSLSLIDSDELFREKLEKKLEQRTEDAGRK